MREKFPHWLLAWGLLSLAGCSGAVEERVVECVSADGSMVASLIRVSHGARQVDQEMRVNLRPASEALDVDMYSFSFRHGYDAVIRWQGEGRLEIDYPRESEIRHQEMVVFGSSQTFDAARQIKVLYSEKPSTHGYFQVEKRCFNQPG